VLLSLLPLLLPPGRDLRMVPLHLVTGSVLPLLTTINRVVDNHRMLSGRVRRLQVGQASGTVAVESIALTAHACCARSLLLWR
jgi:hypothetical protein